MCWRFSLIKTLRCAGGSGAYDVLAVLNYDIYQALWRWARRRHRKKGARWIRKKYFDDQWTFHGWVRKENDTWRNVKLVRPAKVPIVRHIKVRAAANPYDPKWEPYFGKRLQRKMEAKLQDNRSLLYLWRSQKGVCPVCGEKVTEDTRWENHHIQWRIYGGSDARGNRTLLHPFCHHQVHTLGSTVYRRVLPEGVSSGLS